MKWLKERLWWFWNGPQMAINHEHALREAKTKGRVEGWNDHVLAMIRGRRL